MDKNSPIEYGNIKIRKEFLEQIEKIIDKNPQLGYRSTTDFIIDAARRRIEQIH